MSNIVSNYQPIPVPELMANIKRYQYNPSAIQRIILDYLIQYTQGQANVVDPTNPFVFLLEASCVNSSAFIQESIINLQKQYPVLAQSFNDLYLHMSDKDYLNIFANPATSDFTWRIQFRELLNSLILVPGTDYKQATIARNTFVTIGNLVFSLNYPINIIQYANGLVEVAYDTRNVSPIQALQTNIIPYQVITDSNKVDWLSFNIPMVQFNLQTTSITIQRSNIINQSIAFTDQFYYARAFYQDDTNKPGWTEIRTTYNNEVYDANIPTLSLQVDNTNSALKIFLPPVYADAQLISGILRVDVYTTKGRISVNLGNYSLDKFITTIYSTDPVNDLNQYTSILAGVTYVVSNNSTVTGGGNGLSFSQLKQNVINNSIGQNQIPITSAALSAQNSIEGFDIVKNIDHVTNRVYLATAPLPTPINANLITPASITCDTLYITPADLKESQLVINNNNRQTTIRSNTLFIENNGILSIYPEDKLRKLTGESVQNIALTVNNGKFLYNPFYYVLDYSKDSLDLRAYNLDDPTASVINFKEQNQTLALIVNTGNIQITKVDNGYRITLTTSSGSVYQSLGDNFVQAQISFVPAGENNRAYILGELIGKTEVGERIYQFDFITNYAINSGDELNITNANMFNLSPINVLTSLKTTLDIFYTTTSITTSYVASQSDSLLGKFQLPKNVAVVTREQVEITFGHALNNLWRQSLVNQIGPTYLRHEDTVQAIYEKDVYQTDPITGSIFQVNLANNSVDFNVIHKAGDYVFDSNNQPVYAHKAGDVVLDADGKPVVNQDLSTLYACDLLLVDGKYHFATDAAYQAYKKEIRSVLVTWITETLADTSEQLLEQTNIYYYPSASTSQVTVELGNGKVTTISAFQSFVVTLYLNSTAYESESLREQYRVQTITTMNQQLQKSTISADSNIQALKAVYDTNVLSFNVKGLGGAANYDTVTLVNKNERLSLNKILQIQDDGTTIVAEDVVIDFVNYSQ